MCENISCGKSHPESIISLWYGHFPTKELFSTHTKQRRFFKGERRGKERKGKNYLRFTVFCAAFCADF